MSTTLEIPDDLLEDVQARAEQEGEPLNQVVARLLRYGLRYPALHPASSYRDALTVPMVAEKGELSIPLLPIETGSKVRVLSNEETLALVHNVLLAEDLKSAGVPL